MNVNGNSFASKIRSKAATVEHTHNEIKDNSVSKNNWLIVAS